MRAKKTKILKMNIPELLKKNYFQLLPNVRHVLDNIYTFLGRLNVEIDKETLLCPQSGKKIEDLYSREITCLYKATQISVQLSL